MEHASGVFHPSLRYTDSRHPAHSEKTLKRRNFLASSALALPSLAAAHGLTQAAGGPGAAPAAFKPGVFEWRTYRLHQGAQGGRLDTWFATQALPLYAKHGFAPMAFFGESIGPYTPSLLQVIPYANLGERERLWAALEADPAYQAALDTLEMPAVTGSYPEPPYDDLEVRFLEALPIQPVWQPAPAGQTPHKIYEVRLYQSPTERQARFVRERFESGEVVVFQRSGFDPVVYGRALAGPSMPNLTYLIPFENMAQRDDAWGKFGKDPAWGPLLQESTRKGGDVIRQISNMILTPKGYSVLR